MKKIYSILAAFVAAMAILTSCSDVPMPYDINSGKENTFGRLFLTRVLTSTPIGILSASLTIILGL